MLDSCSQGTFMDEKLLDEEQLLGRKTTITVKTLNGEATELTKVVEGLKVANGGKKFHQKERWIYARKDLAVESDVVKPSQIAKWKYLEQIKDELKLNPNVKTGFLLVQIIRGHWDQRWWYTVKVMDLMSLEQFLAGALLDQSVRKMLLVGKYLVTEQQ